MGAWRGAAELSTYLSARTPGAWMTQGLLPPSEPGSTVSVQGLTEDLSETILEAGPEPLLAPGATAGQHNWYVRDNATGAYRLLAPGPGADFLFAGATPDGSRIIFEDEAPLTPKAPAEVINLYEWDEGQLHLVSLLPDETPADGAVAGAGGPAAEARRKASRSSASRVAPGAICRRPSLREETRTAAAAARRELAPSPPYPTT
jgi:hypothetical protein